MKRSFLARKVRCKINTPTKNRLSISTNKELTQLEIYNLLGQVVLTTNKIGNQIDVSGLTVGIYEIVIHSNGLVTKVRFMKE